MTGPRPRAIRPVDQVVRLEAFRDAHPGVVINYIRTAPGGYWRAEGYEAAGSIRVIVEYDLRLLLDQLERVPWADSVAEGEK